MKPDTRARARGGLTADTLARILGHIAEGMPVNASCAVEGVARQRLYEACERDPETAEAFEVARGKGMAKHWQYLETCEAGSGAKDDWKRQAWKMEKLYPDTFGDRRAVELTGKDGGPVRVAADPEVYERVKQAVQAGESDDGET